MDSLDALQKLLAMGGNGAAIAAVWLGWRIFLRFERVVNRNTESIQRVEMVITEKIPAAGAIFRQTLPIDEKVDGARVF